MALKTKKKNLAREYSIIYFGEGVTGGKVNITYPIFIKILRRHLVALNAASSQNAVPTKEYTTPGDLKQKFHRDASGLVWKTVSGTDKAGNLHSATEIVDPPLQKNKLILQLNAKKIGPGSAATNNQIVAIGLPTSVNASQAALWIAKINQGGKVIRWKYGKSLETLDKQVIAEAKPKANGAAANNNASSASVPLFMPIGVNLTAKATKAGNVNGKGAKSSTVIYGTIYGSSAAQMGFKSITESTVATIEGGSKLPAAKKVGNLSVSKFDVFQVAQVFSQVWTDVGTGNAMTKTPISVPGTAIHVKCRYTRRNVVGGAGGAGGSIKSKNIYAQFGVPAGTPVSLIAAFLLLVPNRPRSFQIGKGSHYGKSYDLPSKASGGLAAV